MDTKRVRRHRLPGYPTRLEVLARPDLLREHQPSAWRRNAEMAGLVTVFLAANGCVKNGNNEVAIGPEQAIVAPVEEQEQVEVRASEAAEPNQTRATLPVTEAESASEKAQEAVEPEVEPVKAYSPGPGAAAAVVAPIFEHGDGRGATGCVVIAPPVFLSEEEAMQIISEELSEAGVKVTDKNVCLDGVLTPEGGLFGRKAMQERMSHLTNSIEEARRTGNKQLEEYFVKSLKKWESNWAAWGIEEHLNADAMDADKEIAVEYLSRTDHRKFEPEKSVISSVKKYAFKGVAEQVSEKVREHGKGLYFGTFYDPVVDLVKYTEYTDFKGDRKFRRDDLYTRPEAEVESHRLLRQQVKDFVEWLRGQGAI